MDDYPFEVSTVKGSPVDWYKERMRMSGITEEVARKCGLRLRVPEEGVIHIEIPYYDRHGVQTTLIRRRNIVAVHEHGPSQSGGDFKGKYSQPKGSKNLLYWPPLADQNREYKDTLCPLIVCEGELKAICCKMRILAQGDEHRALVVGVPGTSGLKAVMQDLRNINMYGPNDTRRDVFLAMDWNATGKSKEDSAKLEFQLRKLFEEEGAKVVILRWPIPEGQEKVEQKLDNWLVGGGDIGAALRASYEARMEIDSVYQQCWDYLNTRYAIKDGKYIPLSDPSKLYTLGELNTMENDIRIEYAKNKYRHAHEVWSWQPKEDRNEVDGYIFLPAPLGVDPERYVHENGRRLLNTAPEAHWHSPPWGSDEPPEVGPFVAHIQRLCQEHTPWFLDFLAHCAQRPAERGNHIIVFKDQGGTGKSRLFEILDLVFGEYSGPIGSALTSNFNSQIEKLVIAWWSDPVTKGGADRDLESALKNFSGDTKLSINHKYGAEYTVTGYGRLMIATNKWLVPVDSKERRYTVFGGFSPLDHHEARALMDWANAGGVEQIRLFLTERDISQFDVYAPGPRTIQREEMERDSAHPLRKMLEFEAFADCDIWSTDQITTFYNDNHSRRLSPDAIGALLKQEGCIKKPVTVDGKTVRLNAIRNTEKWDNAPPKEWAEEYKRGRDAKF